LGATIAEKQAFSGLEFIAFGVSAEVVVVIEQQDAGVGSGELSVEECCGETADTGADDDQVVGLAVGDGFGPFFAVAQGVGGFPGAVVTAAHPGQGGRVVAGIFLGSEWRLRNAESFNPQRVGSQERGPYGDTHAIQEIAARDLLEHAQFAILLFFFLAHCVSGPARQGKWYTSYRYQFRGEMREIGEETAAGSMAGVYPTQKQNVPRLKESWDDC
jgi:hypothetical protein